VPGRAGYGGEGGLATSAPSLLPIDDDARKVRVNQRHLSGRPGHGWARWPRPGRPFRKRCSWTSTTCRPGRNCGGWRWRNDRWQAPEFAGCYSLAPSSRDHTSSIQHPGPGGKLRGRQGISQNRRSVLRRSSHPLTGARSMRKTPSPGREGWVRGAAQPPGYRRWPRHPP
jgi:hypothetical protein